MGNVLTSFEFYRKNIVKAEASAWNKYFASAGHRIRQSALRVCHSQFVLVFCIWYTIEIWKWILSLTHEIVPDSDRWLVVISCTGGISNFHRSSSYFCPLPRREPKRWLLFDFKMTSYIPRKVEKSGWFWDNWSLHFGSLHFPIWEGHDWASIEGERILWHHWF